MINKNIVLSIQNKIKHYIEDYKNCRITKPKHCKICKQTGLIWWSYYKRQLKNLANRHTIPVKRVRCNKCGKTFAIIPDFIKKFCKYGIDVIIYVLKSLVKKTFEEVSNQIYQEYDIEISTITLWFWKQKYSALYS